MKAEKIYCLGWEHGEGPAKVLTENGEVTKLMGGWPYKRVVLASRIPLRKENWEVAEVLGEWEGSEESRKFQHRGSILFEGYPEKVSSLKLRSVEVAAGEEIEEVEVVECEPPWGLKETGDGKFLYNWRGRNAPQLTVILKNLPERENFLHSLFEGDGNVDKMQGHFWVSKKGTHCWTPKEDGPHLLLRERWDKFRRPNHYSLMLHFERSSSRSGASGYDWIVVAAD